MKFGFFSKISLLVLSTTFSYAGEGVTLSKVLVTIGPCENSALVGPQQSIKLTYKIKQSGLKTEKVTGVSSYFIRLIHSPAIQGINTPTESQVVETLFFGASSSGDSALSQCNNARKTLLKQIP